MVEASARLAEPRIWIRCIPTAGAGNWPRPDKQRDPHQSRTTIRLKPNAPTAYYIHLPTAEKGITLLPSMLSRPADDVQPASPWDTEDSIREGCSVSTSGRLWRESRRGPAYHRADASSVPRAPAEGTTRQCFSRRHTARSGCGPVTGVPDMRRPSGSRQLRCRRRISARFVTIAPGYYRQLGETGRRAFRFLKLIHGVWPLVGLCCPTAVSIAVDMLYCAGSCAPYQRVNHDDQELWAVRDRAGSCSWKILLTRGQAHLVMQPRQRIRRPDAASPTGFWAY